MEGPYALVNTFLAHDGPVRCISLGPHDGEILTGCQSDAPTLRRWKLSADLLSFEEIGSPILHDHWVVSVSSRTTAHGLQRYPLGCIVTGCMDAKIRIFDDNGEPQGKLTGHTKGVISFSWTAASYLVSGSWDGTAILWDIQTERSLQKFSPHENGVHVLALSNGLIATTSTGESVDGKPANYQIRFWNTTSGQQEGESIKDHGGSIRSIAALPGVGGFLTTANDGSVVMRSIEGQVIEAMYHTPGDDGTPPFVLDCCALEGGNGLEFVSCGEDGSVNVWAGSDRLQSMPHPTTVWTALSLSNGAFITACHDGWLRIFSKNHPQAQEAFIQQLNFVFVQEVIDAQRARKQGPSFEEISKAAKWEQRGNHPGRKEDDVMVFNKDGALIAAQWNSGSWVIIGEVTGSGDTGEINGVWYDHVMPVEIDTSTGPRSLKLGYNNAENPFVAAQRFIDANGLGQFYLQQIADWIQQRAGTGNVPTIGGPSSGGASGGFSGVGVPSAGTGPSSIPRPPTSTPTSFLTCQVDGYIVYDDLPNKEKLMAKVRELNALNIGATVLAESDLQLLESVLKTISETSRYHSSVISPPEVAAVLKLGSWSRDKLFVFYDLMRLIEQHPNGMESFTAATAFPRVFAEAIDIVKNTPVSNSTMTNTFLTITKFFANGLKSDVIRRATVARSGLLNELIPAVSMLVGHSNKLVRQGAISSLFNFAAAGYISKNISVDQEAGQRTLQAAVHLIKTENDSEVVLYRAAQVVQTFLATQSMDVRQVLLSIDCIGSCRAALSAWQRKSKEVTSKSLQEIITELNR